MEQFHLRLTKEQKRHLTEIKKENNETLNGVILKAIENYISDYYSDSQDES